MTKSKLREINILEVQWEEGEICKKRVQKLNEYIRQ
jgi:hypothetical protein